MADSTDDLSPKDKAAFAAWLARRENRAGRFTMEQMTRYAEMFDLSVGHLRRLLSWQRLYRDALGLPATIFDLDSRTLDHLRKQIDWDATARAVSLRGTRTKWGRVEARRRIRKLLKERAHAES